MEAVEPWSRGNIADWPNYHYSIKVLRIAEPLLTISVHSSNRTCKAATFYFRPCVGRKLAHSWRIQQYFSFPYSSPFDFYALQSRAPAP